LQQLFEELSIANNGEVCTKDYYLGIIDLRDLDAVKLKLDAAGLDYRYNILLLMALIVHIHNMRHVQQANHHLERVCTGLLAPARLRCTHPVLERTIHDRDDGSVRTDFAARSIRQDHVKESRCKSPVYFQAKFR
jgi:hypothetical protein